MEKEVDYEWQKVDAQDVKAHYRLLTYMVMINVFCAIVLWMIVAKAHN